METRPPGPRKRDARVIELSGGYDDSRRPAGVAPDRKPHPTARNMMMEQLAQPARAGLERDLEEIRSVALTMGERVDQAINGATRGLLHRDVAASNAVIRGDAAVNRLQARVRELGLSALQTQAAMERDVREILGFLHMTSELERMADHCVNIARTARDLADLPPVGEYVDLPKLSRQVAEQVRDMMSALVAHDSDRARAVAARDDLINRMYHRLVDELIDMMAGNPETVYSCTKLIAVCQNFERIGDRVTNLAEDLVFLETGEIEELG